MTMMPNAFNSKEVLLEDIEMLLWFRGIVKLSEEQGYCEVCFFCGKRMDAVKLARGNKSNTRKSGYGNVTPCLFPPEVLKIGMNKNS